ncbi:DsbA family protein [Litorimonas sp. RW-G-Af-16]|uniref:DsbA family protein n=1 Tax=Litorimonas sp. RW-G-Af-16 TaxID=3241168 RepID=UPI00390C827C
MFRTTKLLLSSAIIFGMLGVSSCAEAGPGPDMKKADVERIIQEYLMENPEIIREALIELDKKEDRAALAAVSDALKNDPRDVSIGPKDAKVTIVEFFDYNCGYCKRSTEWVKEVMESYPNDVRIVFKELPILDGRTKTSRNAALAALSAARQGKYTTMHFSLMNERSLTIDRVRKLAEETGLDMRKFDADMKDVALAKQIEDTLLLANRIPSLTGTPFFVINDEFVSGADTNKLQNLLDEALES